MARFLNRLGHAIRETGQALDMLGCKLQGSTAYLEEVSRHRTVMPLYGHVPQLGRGAFVAPSATLVGDVELGDHASVWYGAVLRGDEGSIRVGPGSNLQDGVSVRSVAAGVGTGPRGTVIGERATVGHGAVLFGASVGDGALIGMGATLLEGSVVESGAMVAAGSVVTAGTTVPSGQLWAGNPAVYKRDLKPEEAEFLPKSAATYVELAREHRPEALKTPQQRLEGGNK